MTAATVWELAAMIFWAGSPNSLLSENMASIVAHLERKNRRTGRRFFLREDYCCRPQGRQQGRLSASSSWLLSFSLPLLCNYKVANWAGAPFDRDCLFDLGRSNITSSMLYSKYRNKWRIYNEKIPRTVDNYFNLLFLLPALYQFLICPARGPRLFARAPRHRASAQCAEPR